MGLSIERKADRQNIEEFGRIWIGGFKEDWGNAFLSLSEKNIIAVINDGYNFTEYGNIIKTEIESEIPFYKYEYDNYFHLVNSSNAHSLFCEKVYGLDLSQHGLIDQSELSILIDKIKKFKPKNITDLGCGNGRITEWISEQTQTVCLGIDISSEAIKHANEKTKENNLVCFLEENLNDLSALQQTDCVLFLDTLYYANSLKDTIKKAHELLTENGRIYAYFSQWIMDENYQENLRPDNTHIAKILNELKLFYSFTDLTESGINHWKRKLEALTIMKKSFFEEGSEYLWHYRQREASRYANWGAKKYSRYLYEIEK